ncbi:GntR family transcriptional regulator [Bradyrhizobium liaoningense]|uniref:GntR family transcriptional regulator n=1 Tax=Bradyrhizobium liaoningense TaxID=43992 RepID=UPI001BA8EE43|nr:GntR family transcriptional regulator [Bradyrhizobium liaoningense]MBR0906547.1 GntR family transcriptional regulator [Bradyrhizobium liaoningense]
MNDDMVLPDRAKFASAADYAYAALRREIVEGRFAPGRRMREVELAEHLGISRTPTRQALTRLELEGLLDLRPRTGLVVSVLDMDAVEELYEMRAALEGTAAAMAAKHASPKDLAALARLIAEGETLDRDPLKLYRHNRELHDAIHVAAHNRYLEKSLSALQDAIALLGPTTLADKGRFAVAQAEHAAIVQAISQREGEKADRLARTHVLNALETRRVILAKERELEARREQEGA